MTIPRADGDIPFISADQMREVDRAMVEDYGITLYQMMEHAGRNLAALARQRFFQGDPRGKPVLVLAGTGGNGGGGLVAARWLHNWGVRTEVWLSAPIASGRLADVPRHQLAILQKMGVRITEPGGAKALPPAGLLIDALIGYSLRGAPAGETANLIRAANDHGAPILALDVPSGLDTTTGVACEPTIGAAATMTLALPKVGLRSGDARRYVGELYLADIGVPPELYARPPLALKVGPIFAKGEIVRIW